MSTAVIWWLALAATVGLAQGPETLQMGGAQLEKVSQATRSEMFGLVDLYSVGLYLPKTLFDKAYIMDEGTPKTVRVEVLYGGQVPGGIPSEWKRELMPTLDEQQQRRLREAYASLKEGDELRISYVPGSGTTVALNGRQMLHDKGLRLMAAFLDLWIGQRPVSEEIKQQLLRK